MLPSFSVILASRRVFNYTVALGVLVLAELGSPAGEI